MSKKYNTYLKSEWWKYLRSKKINNKSKCCICGIKERLQLHHFNYEFKYAGQASKATKHTKILCSGCHKAFHDTYGVKKDMTKEMEDFLHKNYQQKKQAKKLWREYYEMTKWISKI